MTRVGCDLLFWEPWMGTSSDYPSASACPPDLGCDKVCCELGLLSAFPPPPAISKNLNRQSSVKKCTSSSPVRTGDWVYWSRKGKSPQAAVAQHPHPPPPVPHCDVTWGRGHWFQTPNSTRVVWHYPKWYFHIHLPFHFGSPLLSLPIIT